MKRELLVFVLGGARSGKSALAEARVTALAPPWIYIATAHAFDDEMRARIAMHRDRRDMRWRTIEAPHDLVAALRDAPANAPVLVDCLTLWLTNRLLADADLASERARLVEALAARDAPTFVVSNEVGLGIVP
ncbi:MAG: bifunctional adenosylcobinamide kinase/adenosylcobinamide-phosphate guanylyltransferase, partial [Rhodoblastus sp.]|nr:bifunctional adenosylcobinamide kinase/adenosylcobinamide-phosphate guanylyltransferase [Rhodoblastus sp.]